MYRLKSSVFLFLTAVLLCSLAAGSALAQARLGIYFDTDYTVSQIEVSDFPATITGYLVLKDLPDAYPIYGWECCVEMEGPGILAGWELEGQTINVLDPPCFMVGIGGDPLPAGESVLLATFQVIVSQPIPVIFSLDHTFYPSLPGEMVYLTGPDGTTILPMQTSTGFAEVAAINEDSPFAEVSAENLFFDVQPIGSTTFRTLTVRNIGGGHLYINPTIVAEHEDFYLAAGEGEAYIPAGGIHSMTVAFAPSQLGEITGVLDLGPNAPAVGLNGSGREPVISYTGPASLDFGDPAVGVEVIRTATFTNTGEVGIPVAPFLGGDCPEFTLVDPEPFLLPAGISRSVQVRFMSDSPGTFTCDLQLGDIIEPVSLTAMAHEAIVAFTVVPDTLDFGVLAEGGSQTMIFLITNTGEAGFQVLPGLDDPTMSFDITGIEGNTSMQPGGWVMIEVLFHPSGVGSFQAEVTLGDIVPPVPVFGVAEEANPECHVAPTTLDFGSVYVGSGSTRYFTVTNTGNVPLEVTPSELSDHFWISTFPVTIAPGTGAQFMVLFSPQAAGDWETHINLGGSGCEPVYCFGSALATPPPGEDDLVGIFFDEPYYNEFETYMPEVGIVEAYLVIKNLTDPVGVQGWECRQEVAGPAIPIGNVLMGQAVNVGTYPDFIVGLAEPLPPSPDVLLAQLSFFIFDPYSEVYLLLNPVSTPSIPGFMAYLPGSNPDLILPMMPFTGYSEVAFINVNPLDVQRPAEPEIEAQGGQVQLSWELPDGLFDGYHVYRRDEIGEVTRLTAEAGAISGDQVQFVDTPQGFEAGTTLYYSYSLVQNGTESPRSIEVEYQVQNVPVLATRLLPNVPNPFNPQTKIRFDVAKDGPVRVAIYDISGRLVRNLVSESMSAGNHEEVWQGRDSSGRQVPSGAYYVRLETSTGVDHRKIMLLK